MRRKGKWTRIHREDMNPYIFDGVRCEACKMCFGLPTPYCPNCGAKMQDNEDFEVGILVEVVRCKDCVFARKINTHSNGRRNYKCYKYSMFNNECGKTITYEVLVDDNHYCAYGEREEE